jgi:hypothetical protein
MAQALGSSESSVMRPLALGCGETQSRRATRLQATCQSKAIKARDGRFRYGRVVTANGRGRRFERSPL